MNPRALGTNPRASVGERPERAILPDETPDKRRYERYIASQRWAARREGYFVSHARRCAACGSQDRICLHHLSYARMGAEPDSDLLALCEPCHALVHRVYQSTKNGTLRQATVNVLRMIHEAGRYQAAVRLPGGITERRIRERRYQQKIKRRGRSPAETPRRGALLAEERTGKAVPTSEERREHYRAVLRKRRRRSGPRGLYR